MNRPADYDLSTLRKIILAIEPRVVVLDVTPNELRLEKVHESKIEYPGVIFPLVRTEKYLTYAAEPAEPLFSEIVQPVSKGFEKFERDTPDRARVFWRYEAAVSESLNLFWRTPAVISKAPETTDEDEIGRNIATFFLSTASGVG